MIHPTGQTAIRHVRALRYTVHTAVNRTIVPSRASGLAVRAEAAGRGENNRHDGKGRRSHRFRGSPGQPPSGWISSRATPYFLAAAAGSVVVPLSQRPSHARDMTTVAPPAPAPETRKDGPSASVPSSESPTKTEQLVLNSGGFMIPHPQKVHKGGEDSFYIATSGRAFGVADGVGGWSDVGVDAGEFSRQLMRNARKVSESESTVPEHQLEPVRILEEAYEQTKSIIGSSTACIVCLNGTQLHAANLGDSGFMVIRDGKLIFESPAQQHSFNFPFQVGSHGDPVGSSQKFTVDVQPGDVLIAGSDGLLDNVFSTRAAKVVWDAKRRGATPGVAAQQLATFASFRSRDPAYLSPFAKQARQAGFNYQGGKVDDITVVVSYVSAGSAAPQKYGPPPPPPSKL